MDVTHAWHEDRKLSRTFVEGLTVHRMAWEWFFLRFLRGRQNRGKHKGQENCEEAVRHENATTREVTTAVKFA
jgi:hypothetical protein